uniref:Reverse transcriptase Ty1/copia-type domain-containing protein n=1 Tax=Cajanus cajan TaxID=3821 RepID=A0A151SZG6_CAJCA|nr:hypothetical protein KK1_015653 [Cajanus cajan]
MGFHSTKNDTSLFVRFSKTTTLMILIYVNDIIITGSSKEEIRSVISFFHDMFSLKDLGSLHYFLGVEVTNTKKGNLLLTQTKYLKEILYKASMSDSMPQPTPMLANLKSIENETTSVPDPSYDRSIVGALQYLTITQPDISFTFNKVCQYMHRPQEHH